jgi:hypothetical protein
LTRPDVQQTKPEKKTSHDVQHLLQLDGDAIRATQGDYADDERPLKRRPLVSAQQRRRYAPRSSGRAVLSTRRAYFRTRGIATWPGEHERLARALGGVSDK